MAVAPIHGKGTRVLVDQKDLSPFLKQTTISASMEASDVTTFGDLWRSHIKGQKDGTFSFDGLFAAAAATPAVPSADDIAEFLSDALGGSTKHVVTVDFDRTSGGRAAMMRADNTTYDITIPASDVVTIAVDAQASDGYAGGRMLMPLTTHGSTEDVNGATVNTPGTTGAGGTAGGGVAHFHLTTQNSSGSVTLRVQHSTSGSSWATLVSSSAMTGVSGFARSTVAGTVKEKLRGQIVGNSTDTVKGSAAIAFSRRTHRT